MSNEDNPIAKIVDSLQEYDYVTLSAGLITLATTSFDAGKAIAAAAAFIAAMTYQGSDQELLQDFYNLVIDARTELEQEDLE